MTPEQQRIAIAEKCGFDRQSSDYGWLWWRKGADTFTRHTLPDYLNDLNAIIQAIRDHVTDGDAFAYCLGDVLGTSNRNDWNVFDMITAKPAQLSEAFLRYKGKWQ